MELETAVVPRDTRLAHLERSLTEKTDIVHELRQQRSMYLSQISDANQRLAEMETRVVSLQSTIQEKDSLIQMLQQSFLEPDDCSSCVSQDDQMSTSSGLHHSPVSAKKFSLNGATLHVDNGGGLGSRASERGHYEQLSLQIPPPPLSSSSSYHHRFSNGAHAHAGHGRTPRHSEGSRGYPIDLCSPVKGYVNCSLPSSPVKAMQYERSGSLSPIKRPSDRGTHKYYTLEFSDDLSDGSPYYSGQLQPPGGGVYGGHGSPPTSHKLSVPSSNSAPNSPRVRKVPHKPRISQPNIHHIHVPVQGGGGGGGGNAVSNGGRSNGSRESNLSTLTRLGSPPKYRSPKGIKSNTGDRRRNHIRPSVDVEVKSKTPPPNYKLDLHHQRHPQAKGQSPSKPAVAIGSGGSSSSLRGIGGKTENGSPLITHGGRNEGQKRSSNQQKQRHHSVDDVLNGPETGMENGNLNQSMNSNSGSSLALFESLIGDSLPKTNSPLVHGGTGGRGGGRRHINSHKHSKSSPTRELIHL